MSFQALLQLLAYYWEHLTCLAAVRPITGYQGKWPVEVSDDKNMSMFPYPGLHVGLGVHRAEDFVVLCHED